MFFSNLLETLWMALSSTLGGTLSLLEGSSSASAMAGGHERMTNCRINTANQAQVIRIGSNGTSGLTT